LNNGWCKDIFENLDRHEGESSEIYHLRKMNETDVNMSRARANFDREPYYKKFLSKREEPSE